MNKFLAFAVGLCISSFVLLIVLSAATEGRPVARAAIGGIWILCYSWAIQSPPETDSKIETNYQKFILILGIIILGLSGLIIIVIIEMVQESLVEAGYI